MYRAGIPVLAGTDANSAPGAPAQVPHGSSMHRELELLVDAGLSTVDALRAATVLPAKYFGLDDRGAIAPGRRADLLLVDGDPLAGITATRNVQGVWCGGVEASIR
jgi:imidazolonepropionase-like amidohydrolase